MPFKPGHKKMGGRKAGVPNKFSTKVAKQIVKEVETAKAQGRKLAKEVLDEFMHAFAGLAAKYQPNGNMPDEDKFERWGKLACEMAGKLAPYQSPTFRAIMVSPAPDAPQQRVTKFELTIFDSNREQLGPVIEHEAVER